MSHSLPTSALYGIALKSYSILKLARLDYAVITVKAGTVRKPLSQFAWL